jgi:hypothetical protein
MSGNRKYPNILSITNDPASHTLAIQAIKETLEVACRRTADLDNSFISVADLVELRILRISNGRLFLGDAFTP